MTKVYTKSHLLAEKKEIEHAPDKTMEPVGKRKTDNLINR